MLFCNLGRKRLAFDSCIGLCGIWYLCGKCLIMNAQVMAKFGLMQSVVKVGLTFRPTSIHTSCSVNSSACWCRIWAWKAPVWNKALHRRATCNSRLVWLTAFAFNKYFPDGQHPCHTLHKNVVCAVWGIILTIATQAEQKNTNIPCSWQLVICSARSLATCHWHH